MLTFLFINGFTKIVNSNNNKVIKIRNDNINEINSINEKVKNPLKIKNLKKFAKFTKPVFAKINANKLFKIGFFNFKAGILFILLRKTFTKAFIF